MADLLWKQLIIQSDEDLLHYRCFPHIRDMIGVSKVREGTGNENDTKALGSNVSRLLKVNATGLLL